MAIVFGPKVHIFIPKIGGEGPPSWELFLKTKQFLFWLLPLPGFASCAAREEAFARASSGTRFHLNDRFPFFVSVFTILMRRNAVSQCLLSTLFLCVIFIIVMMKNVVLYLVVMWTPSLAWPSSLCDEDECNAVDYTDDHVQSVPNKSTFQKLIFNWTKV